MSPGQAAVEERAARLRGRAPSPGQTCAQLYGSQEDWTFRLGSWQFFLEPVTGRWLVLDPVHDQYRDTGFGVGQGIFRLEGYGWAADPPGAAPGGPSGSGGDAGVGALAPTAVGEDCVRCSTCSSALEPDARFCPDCGTRVPEAAVPAARFCRYCGGPRPADAGFCGRCGRAFPGS